MGGPALCKETTKASDTTEEPARETAHVPLLDPDAALTDPEQDRFGRWPFARAVAETVARIEDPAGLVIGLYGPWGSGKTTVLNFIEATFKGHKNVICVRFNPWLYQGIEPLLRSYFDTLRAALGKSFEANKAVLKCLDVFDELWPGLSTVVPVPPETGKAASKVVRALLSSTIERARQSVESLLAQQNKRVLVLVDDIDRLEPGEIELMVKVIKLCADFRHTVYLVAFDEKVVADALGTLYASGEETGARYLDKVVQVPLFLPAASYAALRSVFLEGLDSALRNAQVQVEAEELDRLQLELVNVYPRVATPRLAKRYANALLLALSLLKGEANTVDVVLMESLRVFYPGVYEVISRRQTAFAGATYPEHPYGQLAKGLCSGLLGPALDALGHDRESAEWLLSSLFPRCAEDFGKPFIAREPRDEEHLHRAQRVCSPAYIERYFCYGVPPNDLSDDQVNGFVASLPAVEEWLPTPERPDWSSQRLHIDGFATTLIQLAGRNPGVLIDKLSLSARRLDASRAGALAIVIGLAGSGFPRDENATPVVTEFWRAGLLASGLMQALPVSQRRECLRVVATAGDPVAFAYECVRRAVGEPWQSPVESTPPSEDQFALREILVKRIREVSQPRAIYLSMPLDASLLLDIWAQWGDRQETNAYLRDLLDANPRDVSKLIRCHVRKAQNLTTGMSFTPPLNASNYEYVRRHVDEDLVLRAIDRAYGANAMAPYTGGDEDVRVAHEFAQLSVTLRVR